MYGLSRMLTTPQNTWPWRIAAMALPLGSSRVPTARDPSGFFTFVEMRTKSSPRRTKSVAVAPVFSRRRSTSAKLLSCDLPPSRRSGRFSLPRLTGWPSEGFPIEPGIGGQYLYAGFHTGSRQVVNHGERSEHFIGLQMALEFGAGVYAWLQHCGRLTIRRPRKGRPRWPSSRQGI